MPSDVSFPGAVDVAGRNVRTADLVRAIDERWGA